jgi:hypothetical protein
LIGLPDPTESPAARPGFFVGGGFCRALGLTAARLGLGRLARQKN